MAKKIGRPTSYLPEHCETVIECGRQGFSKLEMCFTVCRSYETFQNWQTAHPEFSKAVKEAVRLSQAWWERKGREATFGEVEGFNSTSYIFQMKNRFREDWRDRHEITGENGGPVAFVLRDLTKSSDD